MLRVKEILKKQGRTQKWLCGELGITYSALKLRYKNPKYSTIKEIADVLDIEVHELIETSGNFSHFYDDTTKEWLGIRRK